MSTSATDAVNLSIGGENSSIQQLINRITYKPGWHFVLCSSIELDGVQFADYTFLRVEAEMLNSRSDEAEMISVSTATPVPKDFDTWDERHQLLWVHQILYQLELHELDEWFQCDGELVTDPHGDRR